MRSLVLECGFAVLLLASIPGHAVAQEGPTKSEPLEEPRAFSGLSLVAEGSFGHRLEVATEAGVFNRATATLTLGGQTWRVSDDQCDDFRASLDVFQQLPPLRPGPFLLQPGASRELGLPAYRRGDESWTIRTQLYAPDWSYMDVEIRGIPQGPYTLWLTDTVRVIKTCVRPL